MALLHMVFCNPRRIGSYKMKANLVIDILMGIWQLTELMWIDTEHLVTFDTSDLWKVLTADIKFNWIAWDFCVHICACL